MRQPYFATYSARSLPLLLARIAAVLVLAHLVVMTVYWRDDINPPDSPWLAWEQVEMFDLDTEAAFGTWFSAVLLLIAGRFLWHHARRLKSLEQRSLGWTVLAVGFHVLSLDEVAGLHEYLNYTLKLYGSDVRWTLILGPVAGLVALAYIPWLLKLPRRTRVMFLLGGAMYLGGAVVVERLTDVYEAWDKLNTLEYHLWIALEEGLEMFGVVVFLRGLLGHMAQGSADVEVATEVTG